MPSLLDQIYARLDRKALLENLHPQDKGSYFLITCPQCAERHAFIYKNGITLECSRKNNCAYKETIWDYVKKTQSLQDNKDVLRYLASAVGIHLPETSQSDWDDALASKQELDEKTLRDTAFRFLHQKAMDEMASSQAMFAREYLYKRGFSPEQIKELKFGLFQNPFKFLKGDNIPLTKDQRAILEEALSPFNNNFPFIAVPSFSYTSQLKGFICRSIDPSFSPKYLYTKGMQKTDFFNGNNCTEEAKVWIVEGQLDALSALSLGIKNFIALGQSSQSQEIALVNFLEFKPHRLFILLPDNDEAGEKGIPETIKLLQKHKQEIYIAKIDKKVDGKPVKDLNDLIVLKGRNFYSHIKVETLYEWQTCQFLEQRKEEPNKKIAHSLVLHDLFDYQRHLSHHEKEKFLKDASDVLKVPETSLKEAFKSLRETVIHQDHIAKTNEILGDLVLNKGSKDKTAEKAERLYHSLQGARAEEEELLIPYTSYAFKKDLKHIHSGFKTGYRDLDDIASIPPDSLTIIGGRTGGGKTTFMLNLLVNMIQEYRDHFFIFLSYEETNVRIVTRLINILGNTVISQAYKQKNFGALFHYLREGNTLEGLKIKAVDDAHDTFASLVDSKRLFVIDRNYSTAQIPLLLEEAIQKHGRNLVIISDYLQKIPLGETKDKNATRQQEIQKVSNILLTLSKKYPVPIIMGCQMRRPERESKSHQQGEIIDADYFENIIRLEGARESGDIEQDANLFLGVAHSDHIGEKEPLSKQEQEAFEMSSNKKAKKESTSTPLRSDKKFYVKILKNRDGENGNLIKLDYNMPTMKVTNDGDIYAPKRNITPHHSITYKP